MRTMDGTDSAIDFDTLLHESARLHGHPFPGQVLDVKMSIVGLRKIGIEDPKGREYLAELGHGGPCLECKECTYPACLFGK